MSDNGGWPFGEPQSRPSAPPNPPNPPNPPGLVPEGVPQASDNPMGPPSAEQRWPGEVPQYPPPSVANNPYRSVPPPTPPAPPVKSRGLGPTLLAGLLAGVVGGAGTFWALDTFSGPATSGTIEPLSQAEVDNSPPAEGSIAAVVDTVLPTVVSLSVSGSQGQASGSGFVLRSDGYVLTNNHVIAGTVNGGSITVTFADGSRSEGTLVGRNVSYDVAVVEVDRNDLAASALGNSDNVRVGDQAIAIGAPLGLTQTVTQGIISALDRPVTAGGQGETSFISAIQTDAAINPGNSGGPLLNARGEVIGINSAIASVASFGGEAGSIGLGFSIPINQAKRIAEEIIANGVSQTPVIGVQLDLSFNGNGARVQEIVPGGPAASSGLAVGDVIVAVDGQRVSDATELVVAIRANAPGDVIELTLSNGSTISIQLDGRDDL